MISARIHGMGRVRYTHDRIGMTARLDSLQAAVLIEKLKIFADELTARQAVADRYAAGLGDAVITPNWRLARHLLGRNMLLPCPKAWIAKRCKTN